MPSTERSQMAGYENMDMTAVSKSIADMGLDFSVFARRMRERGFVSESEDVA